MLREHSSSRKAFSAIFVYVTTAGSVYMEQNRRRGGGVDPSESPACPRLAGWGSTEAGSRPGGERPSQHTGARFSSTSWIQRVISATPQEPPLPPAAPGAALTIHRCRRPTVPTSPSRLHPATGRQPEPGTEEGRVTTSALGQFARGDHSPWGQD